MSWIASPVALWQMWSPSLRRTQSRYGIPARFALAQFAHEGLDGSNRVSQLANFHHNWAGLKWAPWMAQTRFRGTAVELPTVEYRGANGELVTDAFADFPDTGRFLKAYTHLLLTYYEEARPYKADPLLYGYVVWLGGWATDPQYLLGLARRMRWIWT